MPCPSDGAPDGIPDGIHDGAPDPNTAHPLPHAQRVVFLKNHITRANIHVGDYSYYDSPEHPERFQDDNVLYHNESQGDCLRIGKYCAIAHGVKFIMNGANHRMDGITTFPFPIFGEGWKHHMDLLSDLPSRGDTVIGNDVWLGMESLIMPGVRIADGAIIAARSVVTHDVAPYCVVAGHPARVVRKRFTADVVLRLCKIAWWDWPPEIVSQHIPALMSGRIDDIESAFAPS